MRTIQDMRGDRGWSQSHLADAAGVSLRTVKRIEKGSSVSPEITMRLCATLGCSPADLAALRTPIQRTAAWSALDHADALTAGLCALWISSLASFSACEEIHARVRPHVGLSHWTDYALIGGLAVAAMAALLGAISTLAQASPRLRSLCTRLGLSLQLRLSLFGCIGVIGGFNADTAIQQGRPQEILAWIIFVGVFSLGFAFIVARETAPDTALEAIIGRLRVPLAYLFVIPVCATALCETPDLAIGCTALQIAFLYPDISRFRNRGRSATVYALLAAPVLASLPFELTDAVRHASFLPHATIPKPILIACSLASIAGLMLARRNTASIDLEPRSAPTDPMRLSNTIQPGDRGLPPEYP